MSKRVFIIHGWGGNPSKDWIPWISSEMINKGFEVTAPLMPDTDAPDINKWVSKFQELVKQPRLDDIFIGHSIGCQTILRYIAKLPEGKTVNKVILVAPWIKLTNLENDEAWKIAEPWLNTPIDFTAIKNKATSYIAIFSDNDNWVPLNGNKKYFEDKLNPKLYIMHNKGHFTEEEGVIKIPKILDLI